MSTRRKPTADATANGILNATVATDIPIVTIREAPKGPRIPAVLTFPLVVVMAASVLVLANTVLVEFTGPKLFPVSRSLREDWQTGVVTGWKVLELAVGWFAGFDGE